MSKLGNIATKTSGFVCAVLLLSVALPGSPLLRQTQAQLAEIHLGAAGANLNLPLNDPTIYSVAKAEHSDGDYVLAAGFFSYYNKIQVQKYDEDGQPSWGSSPVELLYHGNVLMGTRNNPKVISDGRGGAIVAWSSIPLTAPPQIFVQRVTSEGSAAWQIYGNPVTDEYPHSAQERPSMVSDGENGAVLLWSESSGPDCGVYAQRVNAEGTMLWGMHGLKLKSGSCDAVHNNLSIASDQSIIAGWYDTTSGSYYTNKINLDGTLAWGSDGVETLANVVNWYETFLLAGSQGDVYVLVRINDDAAVRFNRITSSGTIPWTTAGKSVGAGIASYGWGPASQTPPMNLDHEGNILVYGYNSDASGVVFYKYNTAGDSLWVEPKTLDIIGSSPDWGPLSTNFTNNGDILVSWMDYGNSVLLQKVNADVVPLWDEPLEIFGESFAPEYPMMDMGDKGIAMVAGNLGTYGLRMQRVTVTFQGSTLAANLVFEDIAGNNISVGTTNSVQGDATVRLKVASNSNRLAEFALNTYTDIDFAEVSGDSHTPSGKAFLSGLQAKSGLSGRSTLYVPIPAGTNEEGVRYCPSANSLVSITAACSGGVNIIDDQTVTVAGKTITAKIILIGLAEYWELSGAGDGGAMTISSTPGTPAPSVAGQNVYRFLHKQYKTHFYTVSETERNYVASTLGDIWQYEGVAYKGFTGAVEDSSAVYRFLHKDLKIHFYTANPAEKLFIEQNLSPVWQYEGISFFAYQQPGADRKAVHRFLHKGLKIHFYTANESEKNFVQTNISDVWQYEGVSYYAK